MTCTKCKYQWCWLCNGKYTYEHYLEGKCKGYQFFRPKDENEIQLAFEGKIKLRDSQRQEDINNDIILDIFETGRHLAHHERRRDIRARFNHGLIRRYSCGKTAFIFFLYLIIGHTFYSFDSIPNRFIRSGLSLTFFCICYFFMEISNFFQIIYFNIIMLLPYLISHGFFSFIYYCNNHYNNSKQTKIFYGFLLLVINIFFGGFFHMLIIFKKINRGAPMFIKIIFVIISFIFELIYFPLQLLINQIILLILLLKKHSIIYIIEELNNIALDVTGLNIIEYSGYTL